MSYKIIIGGLLLCLLLLSACNMQSEDAGAEMSLETATESVATTTPVSTATVILQPTVVPTQKLTIGGFAPAPTNTPMTSDTTACTPQHPEWQQYTVQAGDTLGSIARRVNSDSATLASVNCLSNPDMIAVGTVLRVPQAPVAASPVASVPIVGVNILAANVCAVVAQGTQATIWGDGGTPLAYLRGKIALGEVADNVFIVTVSPGVQGWVSAMEAHLEGTTCPDFMSVPDVPPPVGYTGTPSATELQARCFVVRDVGGGGYISVYDSAADYYHNPSAVFEGYAEFVTEISGGYEIRVPQRQNNMWITGGVHLEGTGC
jgi:LysM repeat protein